jgi:ribosomal-protein-alanine N-acetyltransferase
MDRPALPAVIETERLVLRPFRLDDVDEVFAYARDPEFTRYLRILPRPYEREHAIEFIARQILRDPVERPVWAITLDDTVIGGINLRFDFAHRSVEAGWGVGRSHWNQGICTEAARAVIDAAFRTHADLLRMHARADADNVGSQRVMEKAGMTKEGVLRLRRVERGEAFDEAIYSILRREWEG